MFSSKARFSETPCPYLQTCKIPRCLFSHRDEKTTAAASPFVNPKEKFPDQATNTGKKFKTTETSENNKEYSAVVLAEEESKAVQVCKSSLNPTNVIQRVPKRSLASARDISPPPLRRKATNGISYSVNKSTALDTNESNSRPTTVIKKKTPQSGKESLNPRTLPPAATPASHAIRYKLVGLLHEQLVRLNSELEKDANDAEKDLVLTDQALITMALNIEETASASKSIYSNLVKNKIMFYKRMSVKQWIDERHKDFAERAAEVVVISEVPVSKSAEPPESIDTGLTAVEELKLLHRLYTSITGLTKHGYVVSIPSEKEVDMARQGIEAAGGWEVCDRCKTRFQVFPGRREEDGALTSGGSCNYHFGKPYWQERSGGDPKAPRVKKYRCCGEMMGDSTGCTTSACHVFKISEVKRLAAVLNFEKTPQNIETRSRQPVCIDGEMGYTVHGLELIRLTATSWPSGAELFDVLVRPIGEIMDLNSRYSGVWPKHMAHALPWSSGSEHGQDDNQNLRIVDSPAAARSLLFSHLSPDTPLIGHGLENDLNAMRVIHPTVIDTALLFPHKAGLPYRNGLKMLMDRYLHRHIQVVIDGKMEGHDSKEDANAAGDLVRFALKREWEKLGKEGWTLKDGLFIQPHTDEPSVEVPS